MSERRQYMGGGITLVAGIALGWILAGGGRPTQLLAGAGDHPDTAIIVAGPIGIEVDAHKTPITKDAIYYLNYSRGRLLAAVPAEVQTATSRQQLSDFAERDLVQDFGLTPGRSYHFEMAVGSTGARNGGLAPLYVFETTTGQMAVYQIKQQYTAISSTTPVTNSTRPALELIERRSDPRLARAGMHTAARSGGG